MRKKLLFKESIFANLFIFLGLILIIQISINLHFFDPFYRSFNDFKFTDLIYSKFTKNQTDTNIVIVNIGQLDRGEIAELIDKINKENPKVIGVDALFTELKDPLQDMALKEAIGNSSALIMAAALTESDDGHGHHAQHIQAPHSFWGDVDYGTATLIAKEGKTIRHFESFSKDDHGHKTPSFAAAIVKNYDKKAYQILSDRKKTKEIINYKGNINSFMHFDHDEILEGKTDLSILRNKIVLIGYLNQHLDAINDLEDIYFTPLNPVFSGRTNPDMKGVVIHANIISMLLDQSYIRESSSLFNWILAFLICFVHVILFMFYYVERHKWFHPIAKVVQLLTSVFIVWIVFLFYKHLNFEIDSKLTIVAILLSVDLIYFYDGLVKFLSRKLNYKSYIVEYH
jgi:CHASE2 domain-containing sensor protein